jgi:hypothetical protein
MTSLARWSRREQLRAGHLAEPAAPGVPAPSGRRSRLRRMSWYIEVELLGRVVHEVPVSDNHSEAERCYRRARADWNAAGRRARFPACCARRSGQRRLTQVDLERPNERE